MSFIFLRVGESTEAGGGPWGAALPRYFCIEGGNRGLTKQACLYLHPSAPMAYNDLIQEVDDDFVSSCSPGNNSAFMIDVREVLSAAIKNRKSAHTRNVVCYCLDISVGKSDGRVPKDMNRIYLISYEPRQESNTLTADNSSGF